MERRTALWLSHHWPEDYDRCARIGRNHVCRRCLWFYPACFLTMALALGGVAWPTRLDPWLLFLLPVPVVAEWWAEHLHLVRYSPVRNVALTLICAPAVGVGLARYLEDPGDRLFWAVVALYAVVCLVPVLIGGRSARHHQHGDQGADTGSSRMWSQSTGGGGGSGVHSPGSATGVSVTPDSRMRKNR